MRKIFSPFTGCAFTFLVFIGVTVAWLAGWLGGDHTVYVCTGPNSRAYHYYGSCKGLEECSGKKIEVDIKVAKDSMHRTECRYCKEVSEIDDEIDYYDQNS